MYSTELNPVWPRWAMMWGVSFAIYAALKCLTWACRKPGVKATWWRHAGYLLAWPGMNADEFLNHTEKPKPPQWAEWCLAVFKCGFGIVLLAAAIHASGSPDSLLIGWIGMIGITFTLHFGLFHMLSCIWRRAGVMATPIMNCPIAAQSVSEFWGKRWNLAFRDLTHRFLFQPLSRVCGPVGAMLIGFLVSGLIHDIVISWPANAGWGRPTCYFLIQSAGILMERTRLGRRLGLNRGVTGWLFCFLIVLLPCPLLFHRPFIEGVIIPFLRAIRLFS